MTLYVKPISAVLTRDTEFFSNMDPYVVMIVGPQKQRTKTHQEGGKKPKWDQQFVFRPKATSMLVTVYDEDVVSDDVVGSANIQLNKFKDNPVEHQQIIPLSYKGKSSGTLRLKIRYQPPNQANNFTPNPYGNLQTYKQPQPYQHQQYSQGFNPNMPNMGWQNQTNPTYANNNWGNQGNIPNQVVAQQIFGMVQQGQPSNNYQDPQQLDPNSMKNINEQLLGLVQPKNTQQKQPNTNDIWGNILAASLLPQPQNNIQPTSNAWNQQNNYNAWGNQNNNGWGSNKNW